MKSALVTGASRNIGRAIAEHLLMAGWHVGINGRDETAVRATAEELGSFGEVTAVPGDVADPGEVTRMVDTLRGVHGNVDALVNNAGIRAHGSVGDLELADWHTVIETVLTGAFLTSRAVLPGMREAGWGRIVNIAGMSGQSGAAGRAPVVAAKAGLVGLTKALAHEAGPGGVTVNAVSPGLIDTERRPGLGDDSIAQQHYAALREHSSPVGRPGHPAEVAAMVGYLCSDDAGYVTGQVVGVNGGAYM